MTRCWDNIAFHNWFINQEKFLVITFEIWIWIRSHDCGCLVAWFCYQLIARPGNKTATVSWPDPYIHHYAQMYVSGYTWWYGYRKTFFILTSNRDTDRDSVYSCIIYFTVFYLYICGVILPAFMLLCMYCAFIRMLYFVRTWRNITDQSKEKKT